ncbi:MAG: protease complex subunit PrcB family protein [Nitrospinota bacterium]|nr:protease complex subunit PrcB family protein [Nitrospinota bacterium]
MKTKYSTKGFQAACAVMALLIAAGCSTVGNPNAKVRFTSGPDLQSAQQERYDGPKARIAVVKFVNKAAKASAEVGEGMADMLSTALFSSNRFIVLDRQDLDAVINEQDFSQSGRVSDSTAAAMGKLEGADLLVMGAVTEFEPEYIGAGGIVMGVVSFGASLAVASANRDAPVGAVTYMESHVAIDIKVVDAATGRIVYANTAKGFYKNWGGGLLGGVGGGASRMGVGLGGFVGTGAEQAIRACIDAAVGDIARNTPAEYYRVKEGQAPVMANQLVAFYPVEFKNAAPVAPAVRETMVVENEEEYKKLLARLRVNAVDAPIFEWKSSRLLAVFAGEKPVQGHRVNVFKVVDKKSSVEAEVSEAPPPKDSQLEPGKSYPFDVVRVAKSQKPVKFIWP